MHLFLFHKVSLDFFNIKISFDLFFKCQSNYTRESALSDYVSTTTTCVIYFWKVLLFLIREPIKLSFFYCFFFTFWNLNAGFSTYASLLEKKWNYHEGAWVINKVNHSHILTSIFIPHCLTCHHILPGSLLFSAALQLIILDKWSTYQIILS